MKSSNDIRCLTKCYYTAFHFSVKASSLKILAGTGNKLDLKQINRDTYQEREVSKIIKHPEYYSGGLHNDIALLILKEALLVADQLNTICLPEEDASFTDAKCWAAGWGDTTAISDGKKSTLKVTNKLQQVQIHFRFVYVLRTVGNSFKKMQLTVEVS